MNMNIVDKGKNLLYTKFKQEKEMTLNSVGIFICVIHNDFDEIMNF